MKGHMFNIDNGYLEGLCRGFKNGVLRQADYLNLVQCETLDGEFNLNIIRTNENLKLFVSWLFQPKPWQALAGTNVPIL